jgi:hypothetical protein
VGVAGQEVGDGGKARAEPGAGGDGGGGDIDVGGSKVSRNVESALSCFTVSGIVPGHVEE